MRVVGLLLLIAGVACTAEKSNTEEVEAEPLVGMSQVSGLINVEDLGLTNNADGKWMSDSVTHMGMIAFDRTVNNTARGLEDITIEDFNRLAVSLKVGIGQIRANQKLTDEVQFEFQKLFEPLQSQILQLEGNDLRAAQIAMYNIATITDTYLKYFSPK